MIDRLAIVCGAGIVSGKEVMALQLGEGLRENGVAVDYVTAWWGNGEFRGRLRQRNFPYQTMRLGFVSATLTLSAVRMTLHQLIHVPGLLIQYASFLRKVQPSKVVHTNWHHALLLLPFLKRERDIYWSHEIVPNNPRLRTVFQAIDKRVACFVAVSNAAADGLVQVGIPRQRIRVIYNGMETPTTIPKRAMRVGATNVGIVGQVGAWKGHQDLIEAFAITGTGFPEAELHIFGTGSDDYESHLRRRIDDLGIAPRVQWHGFVADHVDIYRQIDVCVVPSRCDEALGMTAIEASFFVIPVIASRRGGLPEIVEDGVTGLLFEAGNVTQLATHLRSLISDRALAAAMGERARVHARHKFDRQRFIRDFLQVLNDPELCSR